MLGEVHADEHPIDAALVRRLVRAQFPAWGHLAVTPVESWGTDHAIFRLGDELAVRLPRIAGATGQARKELRWLPRLAPQLPVPIPLTLALGDSGEGYPWEWSVCQWLEGEPTAPGGVDAAFAAGLARFLTALWSIDTADGPPPATARSNRGGPLRARDPAVRDAIEALGGEVDAAAVTAIWEADAAAPAWDRPPVWIHGDVLPGNLLAAGGRLAGVIDFGCLGIGDPACDVMAAWALLPRGARATFREALGLDDATWARGRGWALSVALIALPYYLQTNPGIVAQSRRTIAEVLADAA
jgi:aminoglycoside phosphotransferase (APT) family kinase protein